MLRISSLLLGLILFSQLALANTRVLIETTQGNIIVELYDKDMPATVKNFLSYVDSGFYNGTIFHRVIPNLLIQGGGYNADLSIKERQAPIQNESKEHLKNVRGSIAMARSSSPHTATSEFFINLADNEAFNYKEWNIGYAVFGKVADETMATIDSIAYVQLGTEGTYKNVPTQSVEVIKAYRIEDSQGYIAPEPPAVSPDAATGSP